MSKFPWGIISGILTMIWSFLLIGIVALFIVSGMMYAEVGTDDGLRESALLTILFGAEIVTGVLGAVTLALSRRN